MSKANVGSVVSQTSGLKNVGAIQEGQFAAYFGSYFADLMPARGDGFDGGNPGGGADAAASADKTGYRYSAAVTLIGRGFLVSSDATTWRLHNAADGSVAYSVTAKELSAGKEQGFVVIVDEAGKTYWKAGIESSSELVSLYNVMGDYAKAYVVPDNDNTHPYMYPDLPWKIMINGDKPSWYAQTHEDAIMAALNEWKAYVYDFDLDELLNFFAKLPAEPVAPTAADIENLRQWAEITGNAASSNNNAGNNFNWVGKSIAGDAASYLNDAFSDAHGQCPGPTVCRAIEVYLGIELEPAVEDSIGSSVGENALTAGFFANTTQGLSLGAYPYQACYELWRRGFVAGTDGVTWWLVSGKGGTVVYEATVKELLGSALVAAPTASIVLVNGETVAFDAYNIDGDNYFKLRDLAFVLNDTGKRFEVGYDEATNAISLMSGGAYIPVGGEMASNASGNKTPAATASKITLNGKDVSFAAFNIEGSNYFKLRDIAAAFDFGVTWDGANNTVAVDTAAGYTPDL